MKGLTCVQVHEFLVSLLTDQKTLHLEEDLSNTYIKQGIRVQNI